MKSIVVTPTYNEAENIHSFIENILKINPVTHVLIVDDDSPDGTAYIVRELVEQENRVHLLVRSEGSKGRGYADRLGMQYALEQGFDCILQMDADFSHNPEAIPDFLEEIKEYDVVIGSRLIDGGSIVDRGLIRNIITHLANAYIRFILGVAQRDCTSGFRCYRKEVIASLDLEQMISPGPALLEEILYACHKKGYQIKEIPIQFMDRKKGCSKLGMLELIRMLGFIAQFRFRQR